VALIPLTRGQTRSIARDEIAQQASQRFVSFVGDSLTAPISGSGTGLWPGLFCMLSGGRAVYTANYAVSSKQSSDVIADQLPSAIADRSEFVAVLIGTNDIKGASPAAALSEAQSIANLTTIYDTIVNAGKTPICCTLPPLSWTNQSSWRVGADRLSQWIADYARTNGYPLIDFYAALVDPATSNLASSYTSDGLHPDTELGGLAMANRAVADVLAFFSPQSVRLATGDLDRRNLIPYGTFSSDVDANGRGDEWGKSSESGTIVYSVEAITGGIGSTQVIAFTGAAAATISPNTLITTGFSVGDRMFFGGRVWTTDATGSLKFAPILICTSGSLTVRPTPGGNLFFNLTDGWFGIEFVVPSGTTSFDVRLTASATAGGTVKWGQITLRNLTTEATS